MEFQNQTFYKILHKPQNYNGLKYRLGLNMDKVPFNPYGTCKSEGFCLTTIDHIFGYIDYGNNIAEVSIPEDAKVCRYPNGTIYKVDRFFIKSIETFEDFFEKNPEKCMYAVKQKGRILKYIKNQTPELCLAAVKLNGCVLEYVQNQTPELCMEAVKKSGNALEFVQNQTPELCLAAVKQNGRALRFVQNQTPEICMEAVKQDGWALWFVENQTPEICMEAVKQDGRALLFVENQTPEICNASKQN